MSFLILHFFMKSLVLSFGFHFITFFPCPFSYTSPLCFSHGNPYPLMNNVSSLHLFPLSLLIYLSPLLFSWQSLSFDEQCVFSSFVSLECFLSKYQSPLVSSYLTSFLCLALSKIQSERVFSFLCFSLS